jgi:4-amino-4-deoxy-L-arabinose transferase-like glycosyltransferase
MQVDQNKNVSQLNRFTQIVIPLLLVVLSLAVIAVDIPTFQAIPGRDSGGFLYIGQQLLRGQRLYADLFDDKPPLIYWINALGLWLSGGSIWGVWGLEAISLCATTLLAFQLLKRTSSLWAALFALAAFLGNLLAFLLGGNFTEEYALPFQFLILVCLLPKDLKRQLSWQAFLAGAAWGMVFYLKQSIFGIGLAAGAFLFVRGIVERRRGRYWELVLYATGFLAIVGVVAAYFLANGTLWNFWDATFLSNFAYINVKDTSRAALIFHTLEQLLTRNIFLASSVLIWLVLSVGVAFAIFVFVSKWRGWPKWLTPAIRQVGFITFGGLLLIVGLTKDLLAGKPFEIGEFQGIAIVFGAAFILFGLAHRSTRLETWFRANLFPRVTARQTFLFAIVWLAYLLDIVSISLSGKFFTHYYLIIFPSAVILTALLVSVALELPHSTWSKRIVWACVAVTFIPAAALPLFHVPLRYHVAQDEQRQVVIDYVETHTQPNDEVLMWGGEPVINFLTDRTRPNRFVFMSQLFLADYANESLPQEMLNDLKATPPKLIIYSRDCDIPFIDYKTSACISVPSAWDKVYQYIQENYHPVIDLGPEKWDVYQLN